ncbi:MAG: hypothetical protein ACRC1M_04480 [Methanobacteriaceae archaeon]
MKLKIIILLILSLFSLMIVSRVSASEWNYGLEGDETGDTPDYTDDLGNEYIKTSGKWYQVDYNDYNEIVKTPISLKTTYGKWHDYNYYKKNKNSKQYYTRQARVIEKYLIVDGYKETFERGKDFKDIKTSSNTIVKTTTLKTQSSTFESNGKIIKQILKKEKLTYGNSKTKLKSSKSNKIIGYFKNLNTGPYGYTHSQKNAYLKGARIIYGSGPYIRIFDTDYDVKIKQNGKYLPVYYNSLGDMYYTYIKQGNFKLILKI